MHFARFLLSLASTALCTEAAPDSHIRISKLTTNPRTWRWYFGGHNPKSEPKVPKTKIPDAFARDFPIFDGMIKDYAKSYHELALIEQEIFYCGWIAAIEHTCGEGDLDMLPLVLEFLWDEDELDVLQPCLKCHRKMYRNVVIDIEKRIIGTFGRLIGAYRFYFFKQLNRCDFLACTSTNLASRMIYRKMKNVALDPDHPGYEGLETLGREEDSKLHRQDRCPASPSSH